MTFKASGRSALIIAAGLWIWLAGWPPSPAAAAPAAPAASEEPAAKAKPAPKKAAKQRAAPAKKKADTSATPIVQAPAAPGNADSAEPKPLADAGALPPAVANAYAQFAPAPAAEAGHAATPPATAAAQAEPATASQPPGADADLVAADEVNELDRAAAESAQAEQHAAAPDAAKPAAALTVAQAPEQAEVASATAGEAAWDKASLIGKIFIAVGGLLTLASAARMFMA